MQVSKGIKAKRIQVAELNAAIVFALALITLIATAA